MYVCVYTQLNMAVSNLILTQTLATACSCYVWINAFAFELQLTLEQCGFKPCRSTYMQIFLKYSRAL